MPLNVQVVGPQAALAKDPAADEPLPDPAQVQVRVVPQAVRPLSLVTVPEVQLPGVAPATPWTTGGTPHNAGVTGPRYPMLLVAGLLHSECHSLR